MKCIDFFPIITSIFLIISKFLDCYTTQTRMPRISMEKNRLARRLMERFGKGPVLVD